MGPWQYELMARLCWQTDMLAYWNNGSEHNMLESLGLLEPDWK